jgi:hypothetical protein
MNKLIKGDNMSDNVTNRRDRYTNLLEETFNKFRPMIQAAPARREYDRIFRRSIPSQMDLIRQRDTVLQQIIMEAKCFGIKLDFNDPQDDYVSPFDGGGGE